MLTIDLYYKKTCFLGEVVYCLDIKEKGILRDFSYWFNNELYDIWKQTFFPVFNSKAHLEETLLFFKPTLDKYWKLFLEYIGCL